MAASLSRQNAGPVARSRRGFAMVEILLATMILSVGFIMLLPAFTVALSESRQSTEGAIATQMGQNAQAYCRTILQTMGANTDGNFTDAKVTGKAMQKYSFRNSGGTPANSIPGLPYWRSRADGANLTAKPADAATPWADPVSGLKYPSKYEQINPRVYGDPATSKYYWSLLYRFPTGRRDQLELWIVCCHGVDNNLMGISDKPASGAAGASTLTLSATDIEFCESGTFAVTTEGEVVRFVAREGSTSVRLSKPLAFACTRIYIVYPALGATSGNAIIGVIQTAVGY